MLSSIDGYCSVVVRHTSLNPTPKQMWTDPSPYIMSSLQVFDSSELGTLHVTQQHQKQLQAIAHNLSAPHPPSLPPSPALSHVAPTPAAVTGESTPTPSTGEKRAASEVSVPEGSPAAQPVAVEAAGAPKKKRRIELQHM